MRHLYSLILLLLLPLVVIHLGWLSLRNPGYRQRWLERFGFIPAQPGTPTIWLHAASVGEVQAAAPLVDRLQNQYADYRLVITTMTPTGARAARQRFGGSVTHFYLPYDLPFMVRRFIHQLQPSIVLVMEMELWPNLFRACRRAGIPLVLINARMSARSAAGYARVPGLARATLNDVSLVAAQSQADAERLIKLGARPASTVVSGNLKFDIRQPHSITEQAQVLRRTLSVNRPVWIAASTHEGEEKILLDAFEAVLERYPDCLLMLAPRHPERFDRVADLCRRRGFSIVRRQQEAAAVSAATRIYLVDSLGELPVCYAASDIAFVGGSLVNIGGHNMLEPASLAVPVLTGPYHFNFTEITSVLTGQGAAWVVNDSDELAAKVLDLLADANLRYQAGQNARRIVEDNAGGVEALMKLLQGLLDGIGTGIGRTS
ncbi:3-deoxy-D-manno-octulosonic-acid transferase [Methylohalomonas lacus]|uniref:3-deoxy-D-manno-octulosonic acid transferase n=1 Tax=Methylohalomonas lacus TaxID=398773 RepID=A0AAE3L618_9GAMM|nr:lipid IV(A) 3-deoxy-D-manno-octulosonic acid transferase [Methylohalomonas lacus]MCS3904452.1 3-deoxy-D-manno-octulosonic-acid transferase [Methylohalomonas lacus]